jgi:hypothetical protein
MAVRNETRRVAESFFAAWTSRNAREARALLSDALEYSGPLNSYHSADELLPPLMKFAATLHGARVVELILEGNRAALLYDCDLSAPVGTLRTASFQRVDGGKIREYRQAFDATGLRRVLAPQADGHRPKEHGALSRGSSAGKQPRERVSRRLLNKPQVAVNRSL